MGRHHGQGAGSAEQYGRHSQASARGLSVAALLARVVEAGHAVRLAWRGDDATRVVTRSDEFPTAVLPVVRSTDEPQAEPDGLPADDEDTEPTTATREARKWLRPPGLSWWPRAVVG
jgi:plasmid replication initiation protein